MQYIARLLETPLSSALKRGKSVLLLGPRQTGKSTLLAQFKTDLNISFVRPDIRLLYEKDYSLLVREVESLKSRIKKKPTIVLDEIQKIPLILDVVQDLIDRKIANFVLTGSSARKLRRGSHVNLLPGRVVALRLDPLSLQESTPTSLKTALLQGALPGLQTLANEAEAEADLKSYVSTYLEEEVRAEAIVRNLGSFARFLELAAAESGSVTNFRKLSQKIGVSHTTILSYFEILFDCLIIERVEPLTESKTRHKLTATSKYLFFDLGVRRVAANEGLHLPITTMGQMFEQFVGLELIRMSRFAAEPTRLRFWRDPDGPEVDWVLERGNELIPIEVKWSETPSPKETNHLQVFLDEYKTASHGYVVCRAPRRQKLRPHIEALPWQELPQLFR